MAPPKQNTISKVYLLALTDSGAPDLLNEYVFLPPPAEPAYILRIAIDGASSICREGTLSTNIPKPGNSFRSDVFQHFKLHPDFHRTFEIDIPMTCAGAFAYYVTYTPLPELSSRHVVASKSTTSKLFYIDVAPRLSIRKESLPLTSLSIFSIISKFMGPFPGEWKKHIKGVGQRNYNAIHFAPLMERGESNSPYSILDQLKFDTTCFPHGEKDIENLIHMMESEHGILGFTDVVWNHTANNSPWLQEHPEAGYNVETAPWLEAALELDSALLQFSDDLTTLGLPSVLASVDDLLKIMDAVKTHVISQLRLWEFYIVDVQRDAQEAVDAWTNIAVVTTSTRASEVDTLQDAKSWSLKQKADFLLSHGCSNREALGGRFHRKLDPTTGSALLTALLGPSQGSTTETAQAFSTMQQIIDELNLPLYRDYDGDVAEILDQLFNRIKYVRLDDHGPRAGPITPQSPLIETYFTRLPSNATTRKHNPKSLALVNNGWIWAADAMKDHAGSGSRAYLRREVIVWTDCVKLRYGTRPADNPFLWEYMSGYTRLMARYFAGFRIDNCHSTPIAVAEYLLGEARTIRPNIVVFAELFTGSEEMDYTFVKRLGLSALIRESMQAWSTAEMSRLVHRHGGRPIGSFEVDEISTQKAPAGSSTEKPRGTVQRVRESPLHALFMDCTHDNELPAQKRDARDTLPNAALVSMCNCATGSVMGYDEIYPKLIDLVHETRLYRSFSSQQDVEIGAGPHGIGGIKKLLNLLHMKMGRDGYDEAHIHHEGELITVHRVHPKTRKGFYAIAHTAYPGCGNGNRGLAPVHLVGSKAKLVGSWMLEVETDDATREKVIGDTAYLHGLPSRVIELEGFAIDNTDVECVITVPTKFPPGSVAIFETWIPSAEHSDGLDRFVSSGGAEAFGQLDLVDLNFLLYRCDAEERDFSDGADGVYSIPYHGPLVFAGLQGWWSILRDVVRRNDLGHAICNHLRDGHWALDYVVARLNKLIRQSGHQSLQLPTTWLEERFDAIRKIPSFLLPRYFALTIQTAYNAAWLRGMELMSEDIRHGQVFLQRLAMVSVQQTGLMKSTSLYPTKSVPSLAAGLPHFSTDWARCWGRDVFISLRGLYLGTGRHDDAREHILAFASVLKHGMIPNLLSRGELPRYNSRDSVWFFLQAIQDYTRMVPNGPEILQAKVSRRFLPYDDAYFGVDDPRAYSRMSTLEEIIQEVMQRHASGLSFREANAGPKLDMQMKSEGFQLDIHVDWSTGLIFGGNQFNCGTWMDKMGESEKAGNKGVPGTPRDGAAIEITGLAYSAISWLARLSKDGKYAADSVKTSEGTTITFAEWATKIKRNFERCYYIPSDSADDSKYDVDPAIINRRGSYKDLYKSGKPYEDYELRPNFAIAMTVAPDLFNPQHAIAALELADNVLRGPTGMATLDPSDLNYRPNYHNSEDSFDFATSKGRNYHEGPEWLWPTGFFLRALLTFLMIGRDATPAARTEAFQHVTRRLEGCKRAIVESPWAGLTELTNQNGSFCEDSSPTQAWSAGCLIDLFYDARTIALE